MSAETVVESKDIVEDVLELVDDTGDFVEAKISWLSENPKRAAIVAGISGLVVGVAVGAYLASRWLKPQYEKLANEQIEDVKSRYVVPRIMPDADKPSLSSLLRKAEEAETTAEEIIDERGYTSYDRIATTVEAPQTVSAVSAAAMLEDNTPAKDTPVEQNVFESDHPDTYFDMAEELQRRSNRPTEPFVITRDEFFQGDEDYTQSSVTYYDGDDVLADSTDEVIPDIERTVGQENLLRFGHGSGDPKIVYVRNNRLEVDFEVCFSDGKFAKEVLGFDDGELQHSHRRPNRKFRRSDD